MNALERIDTLFSRDQKSRSRGFRWITIIAFSYGIINDVLLGRPKLEVTWETLGLVCVLMSLWVAWYCSQAPHPISRRQDRWLSFGTSRHPLLMRAAAIGAALFIISGNRLASIEQVLADKRLESQAKDIGNARNLEKITQTATAARQAQIRANPQVVRTVGSQLLSMEKEKPQLDPAIWTATMALLNYRATLNASYAPKRSDLKPLAEGVPVTKQEGRPAYVQALLGRYIFTLNFLYSGEPEGGPKTFFSGSNMPPEKGALLDSLTEPPPPDTSTQAEWLTVEGYNETIILDNGRFRNVTFRNATIKYDGGPVVLENVYFVNCTFILNRTPNSIGLSAAIFDSPAAEFHAS